MWENSQLDSLCPLPTVISGNWAEVGTYVCLSGWNWGRFMMRSLGRIWMNTRFTQGAILCVCGERKWTFSTTTVTHILWGGQETKLKNWVFNLHTLTCNNADKCTTHLIDTSIIAKIKYFPSKGTTNDVGGIISTTSRKNTYKLVRMEMDSVTWGRKK